MKIEIKVYTIEEIDELKKWFDEHQDQIPETMQITSGVYTPDLKDTIEALFEQAYINCENRKMQGSVHLLDKIKQNIENNK